MTLLIQNVHIVDPAQKLEPGGDAAEVADQGTRRDFGQTIACDDDQGISTHRMRQRARGRQFDPAGQWHRLAIGRHDAPAVSLVPQLPVGVAQRVKGRGDLKDRRLRQDQKGDGQRVA